MWCYPLFSASYLLLKGCLVFNKMRNAIMLFGISLESFLLFVYYKKNYIYERKVVLKVIVYCVLLGRIATKQSPTSYIFLFYFITQSVGTYFPCYQYVSKVVSWTQMNQVSRQWQELGSDNSSRVRVHFVIRAIAIVSWYKLRGELVNELWWPVTVVGCTAHLNDAESVWQLVVMSNTCMYTNPVM